MNYNISCMCGLDYETIMNTHKKEGNKEYIENLHKQGFTKTMEGPGGYFLEPGGYIVDTRNIKDQPKN
jgi:hypothetical protein